MTPFFPKLSYRKLFLSSISIGLSVLLALTAWRPSLAVQVADIPNPQETNGAWVTDMADMLSDSTETELNSMLTALEATNGTEVAVVTVPNTQPSASPKAFATELFNEWGIGKAGQDNGVLFLISKGDRRNEVETGYGAEGLLPDAKVGAILDRQVTPQFKAGNFDAGVLSGTEAMVVALGGEGLATAPLPVTNTSPVSASTPSVTSAVPTTQPSTDSLATTGETELPTIVWLLLVGAIAPVVIGIKPLTTGKFKPLKLSPTGRTKRPPIESPQLYRWAKKWLPTQKLRDVKQLLHVDFALLFNSNADFLREVNAHRAKNSSWLAVQHHNQQFNFSAATLFILLCSISVLTLNVTGSNLFWAPFITWCWLVLELGLSHRSRNEHIGKTVASLCVMTGCTVFPWAMIASLLGQGLNMKAAITLVTLASIAGIVSYLLIQVSHGWRSGFFQLGVIFFPVGVLIFGQTLLSSPLIMTVGFGLLAGLVKLLRASSDLTTAVCTTCDRSMQPLPEAQIHPHLTHPELTEIKIGSKIYEGWHCPTCSPAEILSANIVSIVLDKNKFKNCKTCQSLTLTVNSVITKPATYASSGSRQITKYCHCCKERTQRTVRIPQKSSGSSSSSSSGGYSGSSSSSSSGSSGGGSFGGGSSGGGGAGSSW